MMSNRFISILSKQILAISTSLALALTFQTVSLGAGKSKKPGGSSPSVVQNLIGQDSKAALITLSSEPPSPSKSSTKRRDVKTNPEFLSSADLCSFYPRKGQNPSISEIISTLDPKIVSDAETACGGKPTEIQGSRIADDCSSPLPSGRSIGKHLSRLINSVRFIGNSAQNTTISNDRSHPSPQCILDNALQNLSSYLDSRNKELYTYTQGRAFDPNVDSVSAFNKDRSALYTILDILNDRSRAIPCKAFARDLKDTTLAFDPYGRFASVDVVTREVFHTLRDLGKTTDLDALSKSDDRAPEWKTRVDEASSLLQKGRFSNIRSALLLKEILFDQKTQARINKFIRIKKYHIEKANLGNVTQLGKDFDLLSDNPSQENIDSLKENLDLVYQVTYAGVRIKNLKEVENSLTGKVLKLYQLEKERSPEVIKNIEETEREIQKSKADYETRKVETAESLLKLESKLQESIETKKKVEQERDARRLKVKALGVRRKNLLVQLKRIEIGLTSLPRNQKSELKRELGHISSELKGLERAKRRFAESKIDARISNLEAKRDLLIKKASDEAAEEHKTSQMRIHKQIWIDNKRSRLADKSTFSPKLTADEAWLLDQWFGKNGDLLYKIAERLPNKGHPSFKEINPILYVVNKSLMQQQEINLAVVLGLRNRLSFKTWQTGDILLESIDGMSKYNGRPLNKHLKQQKFFTGDDTHHAAIATKNQDDIYILESMDALDSSAGTQHAISQMGKEFFLKGYRFNFGSLIKDQKTRDQLIQKALMENPLPPGMSPSKDVRNQALEAYLKKKAHSFDQEFHQKVSKEFDSSNPTEAELLDEKNGKIRHVNEKENQKKERTTFYISNSVFRRNRSVFKPSSIWRNQKTLRERIAEIREKAKDKSGVHNDEICSEFAAIEAVRYLLFLEEKFLQDPELNLPKKELFDIPFDKDIRFDGLHTGRLARLLRKWKSEGKMVEVKPVEGLFADE